ncbi:MAG TPA: HAD-IC family P-type ATPase, partial [Candidatus Baltobacteraceae bacterium]|nr:HAD-IC family P-type ATPase [Candidatus Baltobacteraceae bacterium]
MPHKQPRGGLSQAEARARLERDGPNALPSARRRAFAEILLATAREPMLLLLIVAGAVYAVLGDPLDAIALGAAIFVIIALTIAQEVRSERTLEALADLSSPRALVIRDGETHRIAGTALVVGDVVLLAEGDRVPADGTLIESSMLRVDESLLTGESAPVSIDDDTPRVFAGTLVVAGSGVVQVTATGVQTQMGRIGKSLQTLQPGTTALQRKTHSMVLKLAVEGLLLSLATVLIFGLLHKQWLEGVLVGVSAAISLLPEEIPVVLMIFFAIGAWRIAKVNVLTRRLPAIEALGSASILCVDKTGTLTLNRMHVARVVAGQSASEQTVLDYGVLSSSPEAFDPMERALHEAAIGGMNGALERLHLQPQALREYPLSREVLAVSRAWRGAGGEVLVATKGAPEAVLAICAIDESQRAAVLSHVRELAAQGLRVLAVAGRTLSSQTLPERQSALAPSFLGLLAFEDPVRPGVPEAIAECYRAGMRVIMITGDHPLTAGAIARAIGLRQAQRAAAGAELESAQGETLRSLIAHTDVFARV